MNRAWLRVLLSLVIVASLAAAALYGLRTYRTLLLLQSAQALEAPETSSIRGWMTLDYLATTYAVGIVDLKSSLGAGAHAGMDTPLYALAEQRGLSTPDMVVEAQTAIASLLKRAADAAPADVEPGWFDGLSQAIMSGVLVYGYPVLMAAVFFGSLGFPVPAGPVTALAGSLAAAQQVDASGAIAIAVLGSLLGDVAAYGIGRAASPSWLARWGRWIGYTEANRAHVQNLFSRWGGATVVLAMSVVSQVSSVVGLLAGLSHWSMRSYVPAALLGRMLWTLGYFGLGYVAGANFSAASGFLGNLGVTVLSLVILAGAVMLLRKGVTA